MARIFPIWTGYLVVSGKIPSLCSQLSCGPEFGCTFTPFTTSLIVHYEDHRTNLCTHSSGLLYDVSAHHRPDPGFHLPGVTGRCRCWLCLAGDGLSGPSGSIHHRVPVGNRAAPGSARVLSVGAYFRAATRRDPRGLVWAHPPLQPVQPALPESAPGLDWSWSSPPMESPVGI